MPSNFSSYQGIDPFYITLFDKLWGQHVAKLPALPTDIQSEKNTKAAVFNLWVNFYEVKDYLMIKTDKTFSHAYEEHLANRLKIGIPQHLRAVVQSFRLKHHHAFLYCYLLALQVFQELTVFVAQHESIESPMLKKYNYYYISDMDMDPSDDLFRIMKILNYEFLQMQLTQQKCEQMHEFAHHEMQPYLIESI